VSALTLTCGRYPVPLGKALMNFHFRLTRIVRGLESHIRPRRTKNRLMTYPNTAPAKTSEGKCACRVMREKPTAVAAP